MKQTGLTLIELVVTLAVLSILLVMGVPQFKSTTANSRLTTIINRLTGDLAFARTEAIKRGFPVEVKANTADWDNGWETVVNISGTDPTIRLSDALTANTALNANTVTSVTFQPNGRSTAEVNFKLCDDRVGSFGKVLDVSTTGQTYLSLKQSCP